MDAAFWHDRWQQQDIGFHQTDGHDLLKKLWPGLGVGNGAPVFVPLAGKSRDVAWLAGQGHPVIAVELSPVAVDQFFSEAGLTPERHRDGSFEVAAASLVTFYCGDLFDLQPAHLASVAAAYDRAALIALPADLRRLYARQMATLMPPASQTLLISVDYPQDEIDGPPFSVGRDEVTKLYTDAFDVSVIESRDGLSASANLRSRGVTRLEETAYRLTRIP